ncbi:MAG: hypothetical protein ACRCSL_15320 [Microbacterium sp.]
MKRERIAAFLLGEQDEPDVVKGIPAGRLLGDRSAGVPKVRLQVDPGDRARGARRRCDRRARGVTIGEQEDGHSDSP